MYEGTVIKLTTAAGPETERLAKSILEIPPSLDDRLTVLLDAGLFDSAIRDLGAALETRMRVISGTDGYGANLAKQYVKALQDNRDGLPARLNSLLQELRSIFKFVRNEFAHQLIDLEPSRGYALVSRLCWHVRDVELIIERRGL
jgi:DNA-directed RNA polymerase subunit F